MFVGAVSQKPLPAFSLPPGERKSDMMNVVGAPFLGVPPQLMSAPHPTPRHVRELRSSQPVPLAVH